MNKFQLYGQLKTRLHYAKLENDHGKIQHIKESLKKLKATFPKKLHKGDLKLK